MVKQMSDITHDSQNKKQRLGRGLGSLLGGAQDLSPSPKVNVPIPTIIHTQEHIVATKPVVQAQATIPPEARVWNIAIDKLSASQFQPRTHFDKQALEELALSIKEKGIIQPLVVRKNADNKFEIIAGERRWRAAQIAGLHEVPAIIKTLSNKDTLEIAIIENIQREDLNPIEEAEAYQRLLNEFTLTQQQISEKVGKERATIANALRLLSLPTSVKNLVQNGELSSGHAKVLLGLEDQKEIEKLAQKIIKESLSVRKLEKEVQKLKNPHIVVAPTAAETASDKSAQKLADDLQKALGTKVHIDYHAGKGKISIQFYSNDELSEISERIISGCMK